MRSVRLCSVVLLLAIWMPAGITGCDQQEQSPLYKPAAVQEVIELVIITPHGPPIREAFADGFRQWQEKKKLEQAITIRWIYKGTLECQRYIYDRFAQYPESAAKRIGVDLFFGGGVAVHKDVVAHGYAQPIQLSESILSAIPPQLHEQPLYAPDGSWHGSALGGWGILFNRPACEARGVPVPATWADLASPAYAGWVAAADPASSGSTNQCLVFTLLKHGWEDGWGVLAGILANCNGLLPSSTLISPNVEAGLALAGFEPEFVARMSIARSPQTLDYVNPPSATAITPDPITVLRGAAHLQQAQQFVEFVLSPEGQALWALPADVPGGPPAEPLYRYPIRPDVYEQHKGRLVVKGNPFAEPSDFKINPAEDLAYTTLLPLLVKAACGPNHLALQQAWRLAAAEGENAPKLASLKKPPFDYEQAMHYAQVCTKDPRRARELEAEWARLFEQRYRSVLGDAAR